MPAGTRIEVYYAGKSYKHGWYPPPHTQPTPSPDLTLRGLPDYYVSHDDSTDDMLSNNDSFGDDYWTAVDAGYAATLASAHAPTITDAPWSPFYSLRTVGSSRYHLMRRERLPRDPAELDLDAPD